MKLQITKENLIKALGAVSRVVGNRSTLPVLANVLLHVKSNKLFFSATNLEIGISYVSGVKAEEEGRLTVPAKLFLEYISTLPEGVISLESVKNNLKITTSKNESTINGISADEFPSIPTISKGIEVVLDANEFKKALSQVVLVASYDDSRPVLGGVYIYQEEDDLMIVATDSYRLAEKSIKPIRIEDKSQELKFIIPSRSAQEIIKSIDDETKEVKILLDDSQAVFTIGSVEIVSRLIDGKFPDYRQLIPSNSETVIRVNGKSLLSITKTASLFARESGGSVNISADPKTNLLKIASTTSQVGVSSSETKAEINGEEINISLNSRYILDALSVISSQEVVLNITGKVTPCLIKPDDGSYLHLIMPLRS
jgi:DNA polymerase III subunit beta